MYTNTLSPTASDTEDISLQKIAQTLYAQIGDKGPAYFPEGSKPTAGDTQERLLQKINAMLVH